MSATIDTTNMTATQIENLRVEKQKEYQQALNNMHIVELAELELSKSIVNLQAQRKDLQITLSKARHIVRNLNLDVKILASEFWKVRDGR